MNCCEPYSSPVELLSECLESFYRTCSSPSELMMLLNVNFVMSVKRHLGLQAFLDKFIGPVIDNIVDTGGLSDFEILFSSWTENVITLTRNIQSNGIGI